MTGVWTVRVGWTSSRPVRPDEHTSFVTVAADSEVEALQLAAQLVGTIAGGGHPSHVYPSGRPGCVMPTSTEILYAIF